MIRLYRLWKHDRATWKMWRVHQHLCHRKCGAQRLVWDVVTEMLDRRKTL